MANDIILYFTGAGINQGARMHPNDGETDDDIINEISRLTGVNPIKLTGWTGTNDNGMIEIPSISYVEMHSPSDKLILYGYSAGGMNALHVCRSILYNRKVRDVVDLLVTVDVANGLNSGRMNRSVPSNVTTNLNVFTYKTTLGGDSHGGPATSAGGRTRIMNEERSDTNHATIRLASKVRCLDAIQQVLQGKPAS